MKCSDCIFCEKIREFHRCELKDDDYVEIFNPDNAGCNDGIEADILTIRKNINKVKGELSCRIKMEKDQKVKDLVMDVVAERVGAQVGAPGRKLVEKKVSVKRE